MYSRMGNLKVTTRLRKTLEDLESSLIYWSGKESEAKQELNSIKKKIRDINSKFSLPEVTAKTQGYGRIRVTQAESYPSMNVPKFIEVFGLEIFLECFTITNGEMDLHKWRQLVKDEKVIENKLAECLDTREPPTPKVTLAK